MTWALSPVPIGWRKRTNFRKLSSDLWEFHLPSLSVHVRDTHRGSDEKREIIILLPKSKLMQFYVFTVFRNMVSWNSVTYTLSWGWWKERFNDKVGNFRGQQCQSTCHLECSVSTHSRLCKESCHMGRQARKITESLDVLGTDALGSRRDHVWNTISWVWFCFLIAL